MKEDLQILLNEAEMFGREIRVKFSRKRSQVLLVGSERGIKKDGF